MPAPLHWRAMTAADLPAVQAVADIVHPDFPEDAAVFADRLALHPDGCFTLQGDDATIGYVLSHPWHFKQPPKLNAILSRPAMPASTYYIHDLALLPAARKTGAAAAIVKTLAAHARALRLPNMTLVAVNNSVHFWQRQGFDIVVDPELERQLRSYDEHACFMRHRLT
ncbi:GNAT family N-acetyltransferase [Tardiphaga sp.]|uniref:GNAT family N-acetyltransferase n=1 Tax=Tardiphaga sp. TaxID=1926292 RepID=UPI00261A8E31|nr:GNAT family N-acetyltransferase [Tardiphaga sp.]MDB5621164.1 GCN5-related N-acetyltransferase [Tardiphaga sp.]